MTDFTIIVFSLALLLLADRSTKGTASSIAWVLAIWALVAGLVALAITST